MYNYLEDLTFYVPIDRQAESNDEILKFKDTFFGSGEF